MKKIIFALMLLMSTSAYASEPNVALSSIEYVLTNELGFVKTGEKNTKEALVYILDTPSFYDYKYCIDKVMGALRRNNIKIVSTAKKNNMQLILAASNDNIVAISIPEKWIGIVLIGIKNEL